MQKNVFLSLALLLSFSVKAEVVVDEASKCPFIAFAHAAKKDSSVDLVARHGELSPAQMEKLVAQFPELKDATPAEIKEFVASYNKLFKVAAVQEVVTATQEAKDVQSPLAELTKEEVNTSVACCSKSEVTEVVATPAAATEEAPKAVCEALAAQVEQTTEAAA